jgi:hypothetical protein
VIVEMSVRITSPAVASASSERWAAEGFPAPQASVTTTGMRPRSAPWRTVGSIPTSVATPTVAKAVTVAQRELQQRALECGHRELVEDRLRCSRSELGQQLESGRVGQERRDDLLDPVLALPRHRGTQL